MNRNRWGNIFGVGILTLALLALGLDGVNMPAARAAVNDFGGTVGVRPENGIQLAVHYAAPAAQGSGDCSSWANACTLQSALAAAVNGDEIWAQAGVHKPGAAQTDTFTLKNGVAVYGGFAGTETLLHAPHWLANPTILSGDIDNNDTTTGGVCVNTGGISGSNSYHVVDGGGTNSSARLDGFTVTCGQADV